MNTTDVEIKTLTPVETVTQAFKNAGVSEADQQKVNALFNGPSAPLRTCWDTVFVADLNEVARELGMSNARLSGHLTVGPNNSIVLKNDVPNHVFLVGITRIGTHVSADGQPPKPFISYNLVCPETEGDRALVVALALLNDGTRCSLAQSARLYLRNRGGVGPVVDITDTLTGLSSFIALAMNAIVTRGFPYKETPVTMRRTFADRTASTREAMSTVNKAQQELPEITANPFK